MGGVADHDGLPAYTVPACITSHHDLDAFDCGTPPLDEWLRHRALKAEGPSARTYVVCRDDIVVAYYCLATGGVKREDAPSRLRRNMPDPMPAMLLGRLAVDRRHQGRGLGGALLRDALLRTVEANRIVGFKVLIVHAKDDASLAFYARYGFVEHAPGTRTMFLPVDTIVAGL